MKNLKFLSVLGYNINFRTLGPDEIIGSFEIETPPNRSVFEIYCGSCKISEHFYKLYFSINWDKEILDSNYTIFSGELILDKFNRAELNLKWFSVFNQLGEEDYKVGECKLFNHETNEVRVMNEDVPFPLLTQCIG